MRYIYYFEINVKIFIIIFLSAHLFSYGKNQNGILALSDIHFDPLYGCNSANYCELFDKLNSSEEKKWEIIFQKYTPKIESKLGEDTNYFLFKNILFNKSNSINKLDEKNNITFSIINGDFLAHKFKDRYIKFNHNNESGYDLFVKKTIEYVSENIEQAIHSINAKIEIYPVLGNNDSYLGNYLIDNENNRFYSDTAQTWKKLFTSINSNDFKHNGYYSSDVKNLNLKLVVLNSNFFSSRGSSPNNDIYKRAYSQLYWLEKTLKKAKLCKKNVLISFHIPASIDEYTSNTLSIPTLYWSQRLQKKYYDILKRNKDFIVGILNSHTHNDELHVDLYKDKKVDLFSVLIPSISPIYMNNPGFKIIYLPSSVAFKDKKKIENFDTYSYSLESSNFKFLYNFNDLFHSNDLSEGILSIVNDKKIDVYLNNLNAGKHPFEKNKLKYYACSVKYVSLKDYQRCISHP